MIKNAQKLFAIAAALAFSSTAFAGNAGGITYGPPAQSVPMLSDAMLVILGLLFAVLAFRVLRAYPGGKPLASIVALGIAGLCAAPGSGLIQEAYAMIGYQMTSPTGGSISIGLGNADAPVQNTSGPAQQIKSITANSPPYSVGTPSSSPACTVGLIVQNNGTCYVKFVSPQ